MFFILSKILGFFSMPSNLLMLLCLLGLVLLMRGRMRAGRVCLVTGILALAIAGWSPLGNTLITPLEERFPPWHAAAAPDGIIVLGGAISPKLSGERGAVQLNESAERLTVLAALARAYPNARIVFSGGASSLFPGKFVEADFVAPLWQSFGIARESIAIESRARNTVENAVFTEELVHPRAGQRWLLVTSAYHMPRAIGVFRRIGFAVEAYPVDWRTAPNSGRFSPFAQFAGGLARTDVAVREWFGLFAYWLTGRTSALLPAP